MTTSPIYVEPRSVESDRTSDPRVEVSERLHRLEGEVTELRDTIARFADIVIGEVKDLRKVHQDLPLVPPSLAGELPAAAQEMPVGDGSPPRPVEPSNRRPWLLMELLRVIGTTCRMYLDPRYRVRRSTQLMMPLLLGLFALNIFVFNVVFTVTLISNIFEKIFDVIVAVLMYQVLEREVARYRSVISQLTAWQNYRARTVLVGVEPAETTLETE